MNCKRLGLKEFDDITFGPECGEHVSKGAGAPNHFRQKTTSVKTCESRIEPRDNPENALIADLVKRTALSLSRKQEQLRHLARRGPVQGTIWRRNPQQTSDNMGSLVIIMENSAVGMTTDYVAVEIAEDTTRIRPSDVLIQPEESGLHFSILVSSEGLHHVNRSQLKTCVAEIRDGCLRKLRHVFGLSQNLSEDVRGDGRTTSAC